MKNTEYKDILINIIIMSCIQKICKYFNYYYYNKEVQSVKLEVKEPGSYYLVFSHWTKAANLFSEKDIKKTQHQDKKGN